MLWLMEETFLTKLLLNDIRTFEKIRKIVTDQGDNYKTGCLLGYLYFNKKNKLIAISLSKQQTIDVDRKAIQRTNFTANANCMGHTYRIHILEELKKITLDFSQGTLRVL